MLEAPDAAEGIRRLLVNAVAAVGADRGSLVRIEGDELVLEADHDPGREGVPAGARSPLAEHPQVRRAIESRVCTVVDKVDGPRSNPAIRHMTAGIRHALIQPLAVDGEVSGVLSMSRRRDEPFGDEEIELLRPLGRLAALLFRNAAALRRAGEADETLRSFVDMTMQEALDVARSMAPREIIQRLVEHALAAVGADRCTLTSVDQNVIRVEASHEAGGAPAWTGAEYPIDELGRQPMLKRALENREIVTGDRFDTAAATPDVAADLDHVEQLAILPLSIGGAPSAVLILSRKRPERFSELDLVKLQQIGSVAVLALRGARALEAVHQAQQRGLDALLFVSAHMASSGELESFFGRVSATVASLVGAERAAFWTLARDELTPRPKGWGLKAEHYRLRVPARGSATMDGLIRRNQPASGRIEPHHLDGAYGKALRTLRARDAIAVPWRTAGRILGILTAFDSRSGFTEQDVWVMRIAARAAALVWQAHEAELQLAELRAQERAALEEQARKMEELERMKSDFLRLASHELRGPLAIARGYVSMVEEASFGEVPDGARDALRTVGGRLGQINAIIDQLLDAARLEDGKLVVASVPVNVAEVVGAAFEEMSPLARPNQRMTLELGAPDVVVTGDPDRLRTIVINLLSNAIKYSPNGGSVRCRLTAAPDDALVEVTDHGIGIPGRDLPALFSRFGRLERPATAAIDGTGLGLYLSQEIARLHGGRITVRSRPGRGSTFTLSLPRRRPGASDPA